MTSAAEKLRVIFAGHAGLRKDQVIRVLAREVSRHRPGLTIGIYDAEAQLNMGAFLSQSEEEQLKTWRRSLGFALAKLKEEDPDVAFLIMHLAYQRHGRTFTPISWRHSDFDAQSTKHFIEHTAIELIRDKFKPDYFITLIDDIMYVKPRIEGKYNFSLSELLTWRNTEIFLADILASLTISQEKMYYSAITLDRKYDRSPVVSVRHPPQMLYRYLFEAATCPRLYLSFPISRTRHSPNLVREIDRFRRTLHRHFSVFDPLTIDEMQLEQVAAQHAQSTDLSRVVTFSAAQRWQITPTETLIDEAFHDVTGLRLWEVREVTDVPMGAEGKKPNMIRNQIEHRDFRLIDQSDYVVFYRPMLPRSVGGTVGAPSIEAGDFSGGTGAEWRYARTKPRFLVHDPSVDGKFQAPRPFDDNVADAHQVVSDVTPLSDETTQMKALSALIDSINSSNVERLNRIQRP